MEISKDYKLKKPLIVYNCFSHDLKNKILNNKNSIKLNEGSELTLIDYSDNNTQNNFIKNTVDTVFLDKKAVLKKYYNSKLKK